MNPVIGVFLYLPCGSPPTVRRWPGSGKRVGPWPIFCFCPLRAARVGAGASLARRVACWGFGRRDMQPVDSTLTRLARRVVEPMGYELVGVEYFQRGGGATLRVYIDHADGIDLEDCTAVSHQLSAVLDVEDPLPGQYDLEVSSPGLDRPLVFAEHFSRFAGSRVRVRLAEKVEGRRTLEGVLLGLVGAGSGAAGEAIRLQADGRIWELPLAALESARVVPELP